VIREEGVERIDLLKIDVQGAEMEVLRGVAEEDWGKIEQVVMEVHDRVGGASEGRVREARKIMEARGYQVEVEQEAGLKGTDRYNLYAVRGGAGAAGRRTRGSERENREGVRVGGQREPCVVGEEELRRYMSERLPEYMVPGAMVLLEEMPLTKNGKVDRGALPEPEREELENRWVEARTPVEEIVSGIWCEMLKVENVGLNENFFELGGHSLLAMQVMSRVREALGAEVHLRSLFERPTVKGLAEVIEHEMKAKRGMQAPPLRAVGREGELPLSFAQQRLWFLHQLEPESSFYNMSAAMNLTGQLDITALERTLGEIVRRHEVLRTSFPEVEGHPIQVIAPSVNFNLPLIDLSQMEEVEREREAGRLAQAEGEKPFDLSRGPLLRARVLRLGATEHVVLLTMHHIVSDGWSVGVLVREVGALYEAFSNGRTSPLAELSIQYGDYAVWQREWLQGEVLEEQLRYWKEQLGGAAGVLELQTDRPRPAVQTHRGAHQPFMLTDSLSKSLEQVSRREGVTLFMTLLAAWQTLLHRYTEQDQINVGTPIMGRNQLVTEGLIGFFINTLVLRTEMSGDPSFRELLRRVREVCLGAYAHQDVPFEKLVKVLQPERNLGYSPLFQVWLALQNAPITELKLTGIEPSRLKVENSVAKFDLGLLMKETEQGLSGVLEYSSDLFNASTIVRMAELYELLLRHIVAQPNEKLSALADMLSEAENQARREKLQASKKANLQKLKGVKRRQAHDLQAS
jgi:acyl carrier protein